jgi:hypothetical protein
MVHENEARCGAVCRKVDALACAAGADCSTKCQALAQRLVGSPCELSLRMALDCLSEAGGYSCREGHWACPACDAALRNDDRCDLSF